MTNELEYVSKINSEIKDMLGEIQKLGETVQDAFENRKKGIKNEAYETSMSVQHKEEEVTALCVGSLIRYQPFASDLRAITVALKVSYDLSRVCRYLYNITEMLEEFEPKKCDISETSLLLKDARAMVHSSVKAYLEKNRSLAMEIIKKDDSIDERYRTILAKQKKNTSADGECILLNGLSARIVERMADHSCYISSEAIYLVTGRRVDYR